MARYIFITGGVVSSLGKGIAAASLASLFKLRGYNVSLQKLDPYINLDPGTMSPFQHGEVFVTNDGAETDLDLGHYERFTGIAAKQSDNITTGRIYSDIITKERKNIVFMLWGNYAKKKRKFITKKHLILTSGHPSPLSANKGQWFGNNHFSKANMYLKSNRISPIIWD